MRLCSASEVMALDRQAIVGFEIPGVVLMENAGRACSDLFDVEFSPYHPGTVLILAGKGNNWLRHGTDTFRAWLASQNPRAWS